MKTSTRQPQRPSPPQLISSISCPTPSSTFVQCAYAVKTSLEVDYVNLRENQSQNGRVNIFVAAFTTSWALPKLYSYLEQLQQQVLYFDKDIVVYSCKLGEQDIHLGDYPGDITDELEDGDDQIADFTSAGPKNYGYRTKNVKVCSQVRGYILNVRGQEQLNYQSMRQNLLEELTNPLDKRRNINVVNPYFFKRDPATKRLNVGRPRTKRYALVFDKQLVDTNTFQSYPYGDHLSPSNNEESQESAYSKG